MQPISFRQVERSVDAPDSRQKGATDVVMPPQPVIPQNPVLTQPRNEQRVDNGTVISVGPGKDPSSIELPQRRTQTANVQVLPAECRTPIT